MINKKGWIKIVEAFTSIMLITGVLIFLAGSLRLDSQNSSVQIYDSEHTILSEIRFDNSLRNEIISVSQSSLPLNWSDFDSIPNVKTRIEAKIPAYLECAAVLCGISGNCIHEFSPTEKDVFVQSAIIGANPGSYNPKKLNLFCWSK